MTSGSRRRSRALLWAVVATVACGYEEASRLVLFVRVEPAVVPATSFPAQVLVALDSGGSGSIVFRVGVLCAPPTVPFELTAQLSQPNLDAASVVHAWLVPLDAATPTTCGALPAPEIVPFPPPGAAAARASGELEVLAGCGSSEVRSTVLVIGTPP